MFIRNQDLREAKGQIPAWVLGEKLGIHENSVFRLLRSHLHQDKKNEILKAIDEIKKEMNQKAK